MFTTRWISPPWMNTLAGSRQYSWRRISRAPSLAPQPASCDAYGQRIGTPETVITAKTDPARRDDQRRDDRSSRRGIQRAAECQQVVARDLAPGRRPRPVAPGGRRLARRPPRRPDPDRPGPRPRPAPGAGWPRSGSPVPDAAARPDASVSCISSPPRPIGIDRRAVDGPRLPTFAQRRGGSAGRPLFLVSCPSIIDPLVHLSDYSRPRKASVRPEAAARTAGTAEADGSSSPGVSRRMGRSGIRSRGGSPCPGPRPTGSTWPTW